MILKYLYPVGTMICCAKIDLLSTVLDCLSNIAGHEIFVEWQIDSERSESMCKKSRVVSHKMYSLYY